MSIIVKTATGFINSHSGACSAKLDSSGVLTISRRGGPDNIRTEIAQYAPGRWDNWVKQVEDTTETPVKAAA